MLLEVQQLQDSVVYTALRVVLFAFLLGASCVDIRRIKNNQLNTLYLFSIVCAISLFINSSDFSDLLRGCVFTFSFILMYRYGLMTAKVNKNSYPVIISILILISILLFQYLSTYILSSNSIAIISNDAIFSLVVFTPFVFFLRNRKVILIVILLISICTIFSQKRSAIFFVNLAIIIGLYLYYYETNKIISFLAGSIFLFVILYYFNDLKSISFVESAVLRFETSADNGRAQIIKETLQSFSKGDVIDQLFGYGYNATIKNIGLPSHNDFIEVMYNYGILSLSLYILAFVFIGSKCVMWFKHRRLFLDSYVCYIVAFTMLIGFSFYNSMVFSVYNVVFFMALGFADGNIRTILKR